MSGVQASQIHSSWIEQARECMVNLNAGPGGTGIELCGDPAVYMAWIASCALCWLCDFPECTGHPVCIKHGAQLRAEALDDRDGPAKLVRICSTGRPGT